MKHYFLIFYLLCFGSVFSQSLEDRIYNATDAFGKNKSAEALNTLNNESEIFEAQLSTTDDYLAFVNLLVYKADYLKFVNKNTLAIKTYEKAWQLYTNKKIASVYKYNIVDFCLIPLGVLYNKIGDYTNAENIIKTYIAIAKKNNNNTQRVSGTINLSRLYQTIGRHQLAIDIANYGLTIKQASPAQKRKLKQIKSSSQLRLNKKIINIDNDIVLNIKTQSIESLELAYQLAMQKKDYASALKNFQKIKSLKINQLSSASALSKIYTAEAQLYYLLKRNEDAKKSLKTALKILLPNYKSNALPSKMDLYPDNAFIEVFDLFAELQTNARKAIEYYNLSFYVNDLLAQHVTTQEGKLILLTEKIKRCEKSLDLLYFLENSSNNSNNTFEALELTEHYKASVLKEMVGKKKLLERYPNDSLLLKQQTLIQTQEQLINKLTRTPFSNANKEQQLKLREELSTINSTLKDLNIEIEKKYPNASNTTLDLKTLNAKLAEDQATLVNYFYGKNAIYQIIITEKATAFNKIVLNETTTKAIKDFIQYFNSPSVINNNVSKYTKDAFSLYNLLNLNEVEDKKNLIIIPDGFLNFIPFDALLTAETKSKNFSDMPFFVNTHTNVFNSSTSLYINNQPAKKEQTVLGVFPVFRNSNSELTYSINEAENLEKEIKTTLLMDAEATKSAFLNTAKNYSILHLSTHGTGGNFFEPAQIAFSDAPLSINELYSINLNPDLVVLSACETGIGELKRGEGALSVARGFQYAGAKKVLYSLWQISDLSTSQLMSSFYKTLDNSKSISYSNRQSKLDYLNNKDIKNLKKSPYYWSAFTLYGNFDKVEENNYLWLIIGVSIVIILLLLWLFKRNYEKQTSRLST